MVSNANNKPTEIISSSRELSGSYNKLVDSVQGAVATIDSDEVTSFSLNVMVAYFNSFVLAIF